MRTRPRKPPPAESLSAVESFAQGQDGTRLYVRSRVGPSSTTALLCDGICCDGYIYKYLWDDLASLVSVAHWNYRGHGRSALPADTERIRVSDHASDLDAVRRHLGDPPAVLIGHSFGTQVVLEAYRARPQGIRALVLLCGSFGRVTYTFKGSDMLAGILPELIAFVEKHPRVARGLWSRIPVRVALEIARMTGDIRLEAVRPEDVEPYFEHAKHIDFEMFLRMLREAGEHSAEDLLPKVEVPVLVLAGDRDSFTPHPLSETTARALPHAEYQLIRGGTHILPLEERALVKNAIASFLTRVNVE